MALCRGPDPRGHLRTGLVLATVVALALLMLEALRNLLGEVRYADIVAEVEAVPAKQLVLAALSTAVSYLALTG